MGGGTCVHGNFLSIYLFAMKTLRTVKEKSPCHQAGGGPERWTGGPETAAAEGGRGMAREGGDNGHMGLGRKGGRVTYATVRDGAEEVSPAVWSLSPPCAQVLMSSIRTCLCLPGQSHQRGAELRVELDSEFGSRALCDTFFLVSMLC